MVRQLCRLCIAGVALFSLVASSACIVRPVRHHRNHHRNPEVVHKHKHKHGHGCGHVRRHGKWVVTTVKREH